MIICGLIIAAGMFNVARHLSSARETRPEKSDGFSFQIDPRPVDFDQSSLKARESAAKVARQNNGKVFVLHIVPVDIDVSDIPQYAELITHQEGLDREKLTPLAKQYLGEVPWEILDDMGQPADVIVNVAQRLPADLIVMVTHGRRGLARLVEGSIAEKVLRHTPCPVLAARQYQ